MTKLNAVSIIVAVSRPVGVKRSVPQGCALSVVVDVSWGCLWARALQPLVPHAHLAVFLDDFSVSGGSWAIMTTAAGFMTQFCADWKVQLNQQKSALALNSKAVKVFPHSIMGVTAAGSWNFLGAVIGAGPWVGDVLPRLEEAVLRLERLNRLPLTLEEKRHVIATAIVPLLYGCSFTHPYGEAFKSLCEQIWVTIWGTSRYTASRHYVLSHCVQFGVHPTHFLYSECWRCVHRIARTPIGRKLVCSLWHFTPNQVDGGRLWGNLCRFVREIGCRRT
eukprot:1190324-Amphidinium_carterae.2